MRTRNQSKRQKSQNQSAGKGLMEPPEDSSFAEMVNDGGTLTDISRDAVGTLLKRVNTRGSSRLKKREKCLHEYDLAGEPLNLPESTSTNGVGMTIDRKNAVQDIALTDMAEGRKVESTIGDSGEEMDEEFWEDGSLPTLKSENYHQTDLVNGVTIEFDRMPDSGKRKIIRRATAQDKEAAELAHKVHLLCLLGRGRLIDNACNDPIIQASLLSVLPKHLLRISEVKELTVSDLAPLLSWFHNNFRIRSSSSTERPLHSALAFALETQEGTAEEVAALSVAGFRALNLTARFVSILDVASLKPDTEKSEHLSETAGRGAFQSSTLMVDRQEQASISVNKPSSSDDKGNLCVTPGRTAGRAFNHKSPSCSSQFKEPQKAEHPIMPCKARADSADVCLDEKSGGSKRKGDLEFELQLQMALSATEVGTSNPSMRMETNNSHNGSSNIYSPGKRTKMNRDLGSSSSPQQISTAFGARKVGAPLYWAEVYCSGENLTGKWVHVDVVNAMIDGEQKVEAAAAACKKSLRYAVAFAGLGAKDVTRRYCTKWYKIAPLRVDPIWWDAVLAPLKELESRATGGVVHLERDNSRGAEFLEADTPQISMPLDAATSIRPSFTGAPKKSDREVHGESSRASPYVASRSSLEDMELETRALTEPLPTNQQAYRNHHLYALEKWLTKYQILHPKGPVLGFCSGHPVYPRTCVQMLHTKERWLQEGLQVKVNEVPAKVVKRSLKLSRTQTSLADNHDEESSEGKTVLYGKWQTEPLRLPPAVDGIVPKNERGQVDVWSEKSLPPGTVHLRCPRLAPVAKRLGIDFAHAMVGFEFRSGRSTPLFDGIVVCAEFKDAMMEAYIEAEERRKAEEKKKHEAQALLRWYQLLSSIMTQQRLNRCYGDGLDSQTFTHSSETRDKVSAEGGVNENSKSSPGCEKENLATTSLEADLVVPSEDHEHVFVTDDQTVNKETHTRTKRCRCGFSIQVEEL